MPVEDIDTGLGELEAIESQLQTEVPAAAPQSAPSEPELPEKYRGKSVADIVKMHQEAEKLMGRQAQEVGEVRRLADELIRSQMHAPVAEKPKEIDFFENPQEAIRQAVETNPSVLAANQIAMQTHRAQAQNLLMQKHPDVGAIMQDPQFSNWVASSKVRQQLFQAAEGYDIDAADELLSTFKELRTARQQREVAADTTARDTAMRAASVDIGGNSGESTKKVYRRADLIRLKMHNPAKYDAMQDEIMQAYAEDRVR